MALTVCDCIQILRYLNEIAEENVSVTVALNVADEGLYLQVRTWSLDSYEIERNDGIRISDWPTASPDLLLDRLSRMALSIHRERKPDA